MLEWVRKHYDIYESLTIGKFFSGSKLRQKQEEKVLSSKKRVGSVRRQWATWWYVDEEEETKNSDIWSD